MSPQSVHLTDSLRHTSNREKDQHMEARDGTPATFRSAVESGNLLQHLAAYVAVERSTFEGWPVFTLSPKAGAPHGIMLYLHGGGHVSEITPRHWVFVTRLVLTTGWAIVVPVFPVAPVATHRDVYPILRRLHAAMIAGRGRTAVAGDSSGGALALGLVQTSAVAHRPDHVILLSPWLDATLENPGITAIEPVDPFLTRGMLLRFARMFAGPDDLASPPLSPIRGSLDGLGRVTVFTGTHEILAPDARLLHDIAGTGTDVDLREYAGRVHSWMLGLDPDAAEIVDEIRKLLA